MEYEEFIQAYKAKKAFLMVNRSVAVDFMARSSMIPKRYRVAHSFWCWVAILLIPTAIILGIFIAWWIGVIVFIIALMMFPAIQKAAADNVAEYAIENKAFFELATKIGLITIKPND